MKSSGALARTSGQQGKQLENGSYAKKKLENGFLDGLSWAAFQPQQWVEPWATSLCLNGPYEFATNQPPTYLEPWAGLTF